jgi:NAD(P)-dependent dehydrogenase (short-subunit alcohol dehydrogenase family)
MNTPKRAVVVGATNGIGKAISCRLAADGFSVVAVGRNKEGRADEIVKNLTECSLAAKKSEQDATTQHEFRPCDAFSLEQVKECAAGIVRDHSKIDALVMTQGMATIQGFTPTSEGNDEKLTLHFWSRAAFAALLLPSLRASSMPGGPVVMTILSGGVHSPYTKYKEDPELRKNYSVKNAADGAGFYSDLFFDKLAKQPSNQSINFIHSAPGFVASNWGTEMPFYLKAPVRFMQKLGGKSPSKCAAFMVEPILQCASGDIGLVRPSSTAQGLFIMNEDATSGKLTKLHTEEAIESVWDTAGKVLGKAGIALDDGTCNN